ncbi:hypothetical protein Tco_0006384 [Tanacetum coccineum]
MEETKAEISAKKLEVLEVKRLGGDAEELLFEWRVLESNMDLLEHAAKVLERGLLAVVELPALARRELGISSLEISIDFNPIPIADLCTKSWANPFVK